jgi:threonine/homoserine/homoserine lactone efflux protein
MLIEFFLRGFLGGLVVSLPLGPMAILIIQRTVNKNFKSGFYTALGAVTIDTIYAIIAGFSLTYVITFLREYQMVFQIAGAIVLLVLGLYIFRTHPLHSIKANKSSSNNHFQCFATAALLAVSNPMIILAYIAVFAGTGVVFSIELPMHALLFLSGFISGAMAWWIGITISVNQFRHKFNLRILWWFNKISGAAIIVFVLISTIIVLVNGSPKF